MRESVNGTTHTSPYYLAFGHLPRGPLAILRETWLGQRKSAEPSMKLDVSAYLEGLLYRLQTAQNYASTCAEKEQQRHVKHYNLRARHKQFDVGDKCLILQRDSSHSSLFSRWKGPATIVQICSPYTYMVEYNGGRYHFHANSLRKFNTRVEQVECKTVPCDFITHDNQVSIHSCNVIYDNDVDFGNVVVVDTEGFDAPEALPSQRVPPDKIAHLSYIQQREILSFVDLYPTVFTEIPGLCLAVQHGINLLPGFVPKKLRAYRVPHHYKANCKTEMQSVAILWRPGHNSINFQCRLCKGKYLSSS